MTPSILSATPLSDEAITRWPAFADEIRRRLEAGKCLYGDASFQARPAALVREIDQEIMDIIGWSFILHVRLAALAEKLEKLHVEPPTTAANRNGHAAASSAEAGRSTASL